MIFGRNIQKTLEQSANFLRHSVYIIFIESEQRVGQRNLGLCLYICSTTCTNELGLFYNAPEVTWPDGLAPETSQACISNRHRVQVRPVFQVLWKT